VQEDYGQPKSENDANKTESSLEDFEDDPDKYENMNADANANMGEGRDRKWEGTCDGDGDGDRDREGNANRNTNGSASGAHLDSVNNHGGGGLAQIGKGDEVKGRESELICEVDKIDGDSPQHGKST
jgi:hypothetical protein